MKINVNQQVQEHRKQIEVPAITCTPGDAEGAQYNFADLLKDAIRKEAYTLIVNLCNIAVII